MGDGLKRARAAARASRRKWKMPGWMEPYRTLISNTGGNSVEDMMNDRSTVQINLPLSMLAVSVAAQVGLLTELHKRGMLKAEG